MSLKRGSEEQSKEERQFTVGLKERVCFVCLLLNYALTTSKVISGWVPTCDRTPSWQLYHAAPLGNQGIHTITWYPTQSPYPDTDPTSPFPILITPNAWLGSDKYQFYKSLVWLGPWSPARYIHAVQIWPLHLLDRCWPMNVRLLGGRCVDQFNCVTIKACQPYVPNCHTMMAETYPFLSSLFMAITIKKKKE